MYKFDLFAFFHLLYSGLQTLVWAKPAAETCRFANTGNSVCTHISMLPRKKSISLHVHTHFLSKVRLCDEVG